MSKSKMLKPPVTAILTVALVAAIIACAVIFLIMNNRIRALNDMLVKSQAYSAQIDGQLNDLKKEYETLKDDYAELERTKAEQKNAKVVYLTFDDGPSQNTEKILDILDSYNIKATFFVIGKEGGYAAEICRRIITDGHVAGNHTYSHKYEEIYSSPNAFWNQYQKNDDVFFEITGRHLSILRFPGGSNNTVSQRYCNGIMDVLTKQAQQKGIVYFDWNVSSLDAEKKVQDTQVIINSVLSGVKDKQTSIVLMHDNNTKKTTVEALPVIIEQLKSQGYIFKTLDENTPPIQFLK